MALRRLPTIRGVVVVSDAKDGRPLAMMESITLTGIRTAATAALAAEYGARKNSKRLGPSSAVKQLEALRTSFPLENGVLTSTQNARRDLHPRCNCGLSCEIGT